MATGNMLVFDDHSVKAELARRNAGGLWKAYSNKEQEVSRMLVQCKDQPEIGCGNLTLSASVAQKHMLSIQVREPFMRA